MTKNKNDSSDCELSEAPPNTCRMSCIVAVYSKVYLDENNGTWSAQPNRKLLEFLHNGEESARWIARLDGTDTLHIALGDPVMVDEIRERALFLPQWVLNSVGMEGNGELVEINFERSETLPKATRLAFRFIGTIPNDIDIKELLEEPLSQLGVLHQGQMIPAPVLEGVCVFVNTCEHAGEEQGGPVFLDGSDIALETEEDREDEAQEQRHIDTSHVIAESPINFDEPMIPLAPAAPAGNRGSRFVPFQGAGRRLDS